jgi:hypothetical protein
MPSAVELEGTQHGLHEVLQPIERMAHNEIQERIAWTESTRDLWIRAASCLEG